MGFSDELLARGLVTGSSVYSDHYPRDVNNPRIVVNGQIESGPVTKFIVDTGAPWCIAPRELVGTNRISEPLELVVRGCLFKGLLVRAELRILADEGVDVTVDGTFFVPNPNEGEEWTLPNFIGLNGCLSRLRFAVDPNENRFLFG